MADLNLKRGIKTILSEVTRDCGIMSKEGLDLMNRLLQSVSDKLISHCLENSKEVMDVSIAENSVSSIFPAILKSLAFAEAARTLTMHSNGLISYEPKCHIKRKKGRKARAIAALEFSGGISDLTVSCFPQASLQDQATKLLCEFLEELAVKICDSVQENKKDNIDVADIRAAIERLLPEQLSRHALSEGARMLLVFEAGMLQVTADAKKVRERISAEKRLTRKFTESARKRSVRRKRKRSPSDVAPRKKRRRKARSKRPAARKKVARRPSKRRRTRRKTSPATKRRKKTAKGKKVRKIGRRRTKRKRPTTRKKAKRVSRKKQVTQRAPSRKRKVSRKRKKKPFAKERPIRVSPKKIRRISRKKPAKAKLVRRKVTATAVKDIKQGIVNLNKPYQQKLSSESLRMVVEYMGSLFASLVAEMKTGKGSVVGPLEVRNVIKKVFPIKLAEMAVAHVSRIVMVN